ncbi:MAG: hypothetical protein HYZ37_03150 [Candidatus Solibacter usitatus]|nr:hypothetical protein [Candidatus Solibacter usitatus]
MAIKRSGVLVGLYVLAVFASGVLVGGFGQRLYSEKTVSAKSGRPSPKEFRARYVDSLKTRLNLDQAQLTLLTEILNESDARFKASREKMDPEMKQISLDQRSKIAAMLNAQQKVEYEKLLEERKNRKKRGPGPN